MSNKKDENLVEDTKGYAGNAEVSDEEAKEHMEEVVQAMEDIITEDVEETPKKKKSKKEKKEGKSKVGLFVAFGIAVVIILSLTVKVLTGGKAGYWDVVDSIFSNQLGSFRYVIDVRTNEDGTVRDGNNDSSALGVEAEEEEKKDNNSEWVSSDGAKTGDWQYPNYKVTIEGCTTSTEPLVTNFTVSVATENFSDVFTDVTVVDGKCYINVEQMHYWLTNSKDSYLQSLAGNLTEGTKYYVIDEAMLMGHSRYAEADETGELKDMYARFVVFEDYFTDIFANCKVTESENSVTIDGNQMYDAFTGFISSFPKHYKAMGYENHYLDNIVDALNNENMVLSTHSAEDVGLVYEGSYRKYETSKGVSALEASGTFEYSLDGVHKQVSISLYRDGNSSDIVVPAGSTSTSEINIEGVFNGMFDYFNFTDIELGNQLDTTSDSIKDDAINSFIKMVYEKEGVYLTERTYLAYIEANKDSELVKEFFASLNDVTGDLIMEVEVEQEEVVEQYPEVNYEADGLKIDCLYSKEESSTGLAVVDVLVLNGTGEEVEIMLTDFTLKDHLGSIIPANNNTLLVDYDKDWDTSKSIESVVIPSEGYTYLKLYFVQPADKGYTEIYLGDTLLGVLALY